MNNTAFNPAFIVALVIGTAMLLSVCFVYIKHRTFGLGGATLTGFAVILIGMSVWKSINVSFDEKGITARLDQVEAVAQVASKETKDLTKDLSDVREVAVEANEKADFLVLRQWLKPGEIRNRERWDILQDWLNTNNINMSVASFINAQEMELLRKQAVDDFKIKGLMKFE